MSADRTSEPVDGRSGAGAASSPAAPGTSPGEIVALAWWFGIAAGVVYAVTQLVRQQALGRLAFVSREVVWMAPLANVVLFVPLALLIALVMRGRPFGRTVACGVFAFLATLAQLLPHGAIATWAQVILALGVAVQLTTYYVRHLPRTRPLLVRSSLVMTVALLAVAGAQRGWRAAGRRAAIAALPVAPPDAPNVLLIILDTVRGDNLSLYGYPRPTTPQLLRRASESTVFDLAFSTAPWTLPSHGSILTGRYPVDLPHDWLRPIATGAGTVAERFRDHGYLTGGFVANLSYTSYETGLSRGFIDYQDYPIEPRLILKHSPLALSRVVQQVARIRSLGDLRRAAGRLTIAPGGHAGWHPVRAKSISDRFLGWEAGRQGRPYFAFLNYMNAHDPYRAPDSISARFGTGTPIDRYDAAIARLDAEVGRVLDELQRRGTLDRTIVVVTADHGELFGEHGLKGHAHALYRQLLQVPLLVRYPARVPAGVRIEQPVSLRDVAATLLDLAGIAPGTLPGASLARTWTPVDDGDPSPVFASVIRGQNVSARFPNAGGPLWTVLDDDQQLIRTARGEEQLFDYRDDRQQAHDEIQAPEMRAEVARLRSLLVGTARLR